ncbi:MAG: SEL1-like repeat protein [Proteobacteria bacterium]|nr:SEL1-like repeat protein [Pseudomonadota bacterium]MBU1610769.1 SEL1-like repeat protein [Pseudomonadota bacterium]
MYYNGEGVPKDDVEAYKWFNLSAAQGNSDASNNRDIIFKTMTRAQIQKGQQLSKEWNPKQ